MIGRKIVSFALTAGCLVPIVALLGCEHDYFDLSRVSGHEWEAPPQTISVAIAPARVTLSVGGQATVRAIVRRADGSVYEDARVAFQSSDTTVATVWSLENGPEPTTAIVRGRAIGEVWITASFALKSGRAHVTVN